MLNILNSPIDNFQIHPEVMKTHSDRELDSLMYTLKKFGQQNPLLVVERRGQLYIIDGVSRFKAATQLALPSLIYKIVDVDDDKIIEQRLLYNMKTKKSIIEICFEGQYVLDLIGKSQGKKRELLGFENLTNDNEYGLIGKDRFELTCALLGIEMRSSTLRKLMKVFWEEYNPEGKSHTGILELLNEGRISIDRAHHLLWKKECKKKELDKSQMAKVNMVHSNLLDETKPYQLYLKSSLVMDDIPSNSVDMAGDSHPYWQQREYRNQDEMCHGQEPTLEEYLENFKKFNEEKFRVLKPGGVLVTIIGETYKNGYQGVCSRAELVLQEIGFKILDVVIWVKSNQKYAPHPWRFQNCYERIIVAYKPGADSYFANVYRKGSVETFKIKKTSSGGYYVASPETCIPNVIITPTCNPREFEVIDPNFKHDAPCPPEIYEILIEAYSRPGETVLDSFVGAGTVGVGLKMGRKVIGYDIDPLNIEFSQKRFEWFLGNGNENILSVAA